MKRIVLTLGLVVAALATAKPAAPTTGVQQIYGAKPGPGGTFTETTYPGFGPGAPVGPVVGPQMRGSFGGPIGSTVPSPRLNTPVTGPGPMPSARGGTLTITPAQGVPAIRGSSIIAPRGSNFGPGYEEEFPGAPGGPAQPTLTPGGMFNLRGEQGGAEIMRGQVVSGPAGRVTGPSNETVEQEVTKEIQGIPPHVPGKLTPVISTHGGGEITAPPGGPAISRRMATETQPTIVQGGAQEIYGARPGLHGTYVEQTFPPAQPTVPPAKPGVPPAGWIATGGAAAQKTGPTLHGVPVLPPTGPSTTTGKETQTIVTPIKPTGPSTTKGKLVVPMGPIKRGPVLKPTQLGAPTLPTEPNISKQPSTIIVKHTVTTTVPTVTVTKGGTTEVTSKPVWVSQNKWERSGGWTGSRKVKRGEKNIRTGGVIVISGSRTLSPIHQAPWIHISTWSPWVTRWNNWWTNWAPYIYQPTWVSWSYPSWWSYLPTWYVDLGLTSELLISLAKQHQYTELYQYFNGAVDQLQGELDRLNYEIQELTVRQFTEAIACLQAQVDEIQQEVDSLNQDIAWVTVKASYESGAQVGY